MNDDLKDLETLADALEENRRKARERQASVPRGWNHLGTFQVTSGRLRVTDPCYERDTWCAGVIDNVVRGEWGATVFLKDTSGGWGVRVWVLEVQALGATRILLPWERTEFEVGVDSGQAGFFDDVMFKGRDQDEEFYDRVCDVTCSEDRLVPAGTIDGVGVVSSSGYGDGGYVCEFRRGEDGRVVAARIIFIDESCDDSD